MNKYLFCAAIIFGACNSYAGGYFSKAEYLNAEDTTISSKKPSSIDDITGEQWVGIINDDPLLSKELLEFGGRFIESSVEYGDFGKTNRNLNINAENLAVVVSAIISADSLDDVEKRKALARFFNKYTFGIINSKVNEVWKGFSETHRLNFNLDYTKPCDIGIGHRISDQLAKFPSWSCYFKINREGIDKSEWEMILNRSVSLDLAGRHLGSNGLKDFCDALAENKTLVNLNMLINSLGVEGAQLLAGAIEKNKTLLVLNISTNGIGDEGAMAILKAFDVRGIPPKSLNFSFNQLSDSVKEDINKWGEEKKVKIHLGKI